MPQKTDVIIHFTAGQSRIKGKTLAFKPKYRSITGVDKRKIRKILVGDFTVKRMVLSLVFIYACLALFVYLFSDRIIFWGQGRESSYKDGPEILKIETKDGVEISALYLSEPNSEFTILYSHGNAEDIGDIREVLEAFQNKGFSVLAYDYRGYGTSDGTPSERNTYEDAEAVYEYLAGKLGCPPDRIIALGRSLGGAAAMHLACREKLAGLILESSFVTAFRVTTHIPLLPFDKLRNIDKIRQVQCPVLVIHGRDDKTIPFRHGEKLFEAANEPKLKFWVDDAGHNDLFWIAGARYWEITKEFTDVIRANRRNLVNKEPPKP
jgi:pimeloyl-ACP methyl ester carboxylesterase